MLRESGEPEVVHQIAGARIKSNAEQAVSGANPGVAFPGECGAEFIDERPRVYYGNILMLCVAAIVILMGVRGAFSFVKNEFETYSVASPGSVAVEQENMNTQSTSVDRETGRQEYAAVTDSPPTVSTENNMGATVESSGEAPTFAYPADSPVGSYALVDTRSQNISCELRVDKVGCSVAERRYREKGKEDCPSDGLFSIAVSDSLPELACGAEYLGARGDYVYRMSYGETVVGPNGSVYACKAEETGVSCWNQQTGQGFKVDRDNFDYSPRPGW